MRPRWWGGRRRAPWRPMLRIAWRGARRNRARTVLIAVLVGLPVLVGTSVDLVLRTLEPTGEAAAQWRLGSADAAVTVTGLRSIEVPGFNRSGAHLWMDLEGLEIDEGPPRHSPDQVDVKGLLPPDSRTVPAPRRWLGSLRTDERALGVTVFSYDSRDPLVEGMARLSAGRLPRADDELAIAPDIADRLGLVGEDGRLRDGATVTTGSGKKLSVTGLAAQKERLRESVIAPATTLTEPSEPLDVRTTFGWGETSQSHLVDLPEMETSELKALAQRLGDQGIVLWPRGAYLYEDRWDSGGVTDLYERLEDSETLGIALLCIGFGLIEVMLLAGAAFAVGARRQTRELGLVSAAGGSRKDLRKVVLAQGAVIGLIGSAGGVLLSVALVVTARPLFERLAGVAVSDWGFALLDYGFLILLGVLSAVAAAVVPAIGAARMNPVAALSGRFQSLRTVARVPKVAVGLVVAGVLAGLAGAAQVTDDFAAYERITAQARTTGDLEFQPVPYVGLSLVLLGFVLTTAGLGWLLPAAVSWVAQTGRRMPLSIRYAFRDATRHRHRTGPAAAAIMVVVAGATGTAFGFAGEEARQRAETIPELPPGDAVVGPDYSVRHDPTRRPISVRRRRSRPTFRVSGCIPCGGSSSLRRGSPRRNWRSPMFSAR